MREEGVIHGEATVNGVRLHYVEAGAGPLVLLLHGFPQFWYGWRHQIPALVEAGFRVIAPDLRGYNASGKPPGLANYRMTALLEDVLGLIAAVGEERASLVGHDWGGVIGWYLAMRRPEVLERLVVINAPHPAVFARELRTPGQLLRSSYAFFFQLPWLPEALIRARDYALVRRVLRRDPVHPGAFDEEDIRRHVEAIDQPGALTAMINYYRAAARRSLPGQARRIEPTEVPTLLIWGEQDRYLRNQLTEGLGAWVKDLRVERLPDASHWVMSDAPERVNRLLIDFLRA